MITIYQTIAEETFVDFTYEPFNFRASVVQSNTVAPLHPSHLFVSSIYQVPSSQRSPLNPCGHVQRNPPIVFTHVPWFLHGLFEHSSISTPIKSNRVSEPCLECAFLHFKLEIENSRVLSELRAFF